MFLWNSHKRAGRSQDGGWLTGRRREKHLWTASRLARSVCTLQAPPNELTSMRFVSGDKDREQLTISRTAPVASMPMRFLAFNEAYLCFCIPLQ